MCSELWNAVEQLIRLKYFRTVPFCEGTEFYLDAYCRVFINILIFLVWIYPSTNCQVALLWGCDPLSPLPDLYPSH